MNIWHISSKAASKLALWRINETEFRVTRFDAATPLLTSPSYILLDKLFEPVLSQMKEQVSWKPAVIHEPLRQIEWSNFNDLKINTQLEVKAINKLDASGCNIWVYAEKHVFLSEPAKEAFEAIANGTLQFTPAPAFFKSIK